MAQITNRASLSYNGTTVRSNLAVGEIVEVLSVTKTPVDTTYETGGTVVYIVSIVNSGDADETGISVTDDLGAYTFGTQTLYPLTYIDGSAKVYENGTLLPSPAVTAGPPLAVTGLTVPAGGNVTVIYGAEVNSFAPPEAGGTIVNTATVDGTGTGAITATATVTQSDEPVLSIEKSISPSAVREKGRLTYTFVIGNSGPADAASGNGVTVTDVLDPVLNDLTASLNGTALNAGTDYTYSEVTGVFETVAGVITVPAATYSQDGTTGEWTTEPGTSTLTITGTLS